MDVTSTKLTDWRDDKVAVAMVKVVVTMVGEDDWRWAGKVVVAMVVYEEEKDGRCKELVMYSSKPKQTTLVLHPMQTDSPEYAFTLIHCLHIHPSIHQPTRDDAEGCLINHFELSATSPCMVLKQYAVLEPTSACLRRSAAHGRG